MDRINIKKYAGIPGQNSVQAGNPEEMMLYRMQ
jgi:hypothetical protein